MINRSQLGKTTMRQKMKRSTYKNGKLVGGQKKLDANKDGKISKEDFDLLKKKEEEKEKI